MKLVLLLTKKLNIFKFVIQCRTFIHYLIPLAMFIGCDLSAQFIVPFAYWKQGRRLSLQCESGCYPTPNTPFTSAQYYVPVGYTATLRAISLSNPSGDNFCFGPVGGGCVNNAFTVGVYPLACPGSGNSSIDGSSDPLTADYVPTTVGSDICNLTDYGEANTMASATMTTFNPVLITSPVTSQASPWNMCVTQTKAMTGTGGLGTLAWSIASGPGSLAPATGTSSTYTANATPGSVTIQLIDPTTSMIANAYISVSNTMTMTPSTTTLGVAINSQTKMHYPASTGYTRTANLAFVSNCGVQNYSAACTGGDSTVTPTAGIANGVSVFYTPATTGSTSTFTMSDSAGSPQTVTRTIQNLVPVNVVSGWGYHACVTYSHSSFAAGTYKLKCWGSNAYGETGNGATIAVGKNATDLGYGLQFVKNTGSAGAEMLVKDVAVGIYHSCAILSDNTVKCWGRNNYGQLGYDNLTNSTSPSASTVNVGAGTPSKIYAGAFKTCVIFTDNRVKCWGRNVGDLGQDNTINYGSDATTSSMAGLGYISIAGSFLTAQKIVITENATCALTNAAFVPGASKVYCWGYGNNTTCNFGTLPDTNYCGELGRGTQNANWGDGTNLMSALTPVNLSVTGSEVVIDIAAGRKHICAIIAPNAVATTGQPICWGRNNRGQLGINSTTSIGTTGTPTTRVAGVTTAASLSLGAEVSCVIMATGDGKCWGRGGYGQLLGSNNSSYTLNLSDDASPGIAGLINMSIGTGLTFKKMAAGYAWSCGILNNDFMKCWGAQFCGTGTNTVNSGCLMSGVSISLSTTNPVASPNMMNGRYIGDNVNEVGDLLLYVNH